MFLKARSNSHTMDQATIMDLILKCGDWKKDSELHDVMLIPINHCTEYTAWTVEKNGEKYLRLYCSLLVFLPKKTEEYIS